MWKLESGDESARLGAAKWLAESGSVEAIPPLLEAYAEAERAGTLENHWARQVSQIVSKAQVRALPYLDEPLRSEVPEIRFYSAHLLASNPAIAARCVSSLATTLYDEYDWTRFKAAAALGLVGSPAAEAVPDLVNSLTDVDDDVKSKAAEAILLINPGDDGAIGSAVETLRRLSGTADDSTRQWIMGLLERFRSSEDVTVE